MAGFVLIAGCCELGFFRIIIGSLHVLQIDVAATFSLHIWDSP